MVEWRREVSSYLREGVQESQGTGDDDRFVEFVVENYVKRSRSIILKHSEVQSNDAELSRFQRVLSTIPGRRPKFLKGFSSALERFELQEDSAACDMLEVLIDFADAWTETSATSIAGTVRKKPVITSSASAATYRLGAPSLAGEPGQPSEMADVLRNLDECSPVEGGVLFEANSHCPRGHVLLTSLGRERICDGCGLDPIQPWETSYSCFPCNYDMCVTCRGVTAAYFERYIQEQHRDLNISEALLGPENDAILRGKENLALALRQQGHFDAAVVLQREVLESVSRNFVHDHLTVCEARLLLMVTLMECNRLEECLPLAWQDLTIKENKLGHEHAVSIETRGALSFFLRQLRLFNEAENLIRQNLAIRDDVNQADYWVHIAVHLSIILFLQGRRAEAARAHEDAVCRAKLLRGRAPESLMPGPDAWYSTFHRKDVSEAVEALGSWSIFDELYGAIWRPNRQHGDILEQMFQKPTFCKFWPGLSPAADVATLPVASLYS